MDLNAIRQEVVTIARDAGEILRKHFNTPLAYDTKSTELDIVTAADKEAEAMITDVLLDKFPGHHVVGEEGGGSGAPAEKAHYFWFIDPVDGTTNFANGIPHFCTSIALTDAQRVPLVGVIYDPMRDELYTATQGGGAWLNDQPMHVSQAETLVQSVVASGFPYDKMTNTDNNIKQWGAMMIRTRGIRRFGSAALDFAYVAAGRFDGYWERTLNPWDALAGMLMVHEAGGRVTDYQGGDQPQWDAQGRYVATNSHIHQAMLDVLQSVS